MPRRTRRLVRLSVAALALWGVVHVGNDVLRRFESSAPSESMGATNAGRLIHGKRLPSSGPGFATYSRFGSFIGRTYVNSRVRDAMLEAYAALHAERPETTYLYGETGWPRGGRFRPHRTHRNGLSVDFMVPVLRDGRPALIPRGLFNTFGYGVSFDDSGQNGRFAIDFEAMAAHLDHLERTAAAHGLAIEVVIFAPELQDDLAAAPGGAAVLQRLRFSRHPSWVRHDDHYHVDFRIVEGA
jgi:penicillin-insensitive murein DD-endopeptidase